LLISKSLWNF